MKAPPIDKSDFRFFDRLRVRWAEVDMQRIVFNGHYLMYFDTAIAGYWRALALPYHETMEALQGDLFVRKATLEYEGSARYDELCEVGIRCARIGNSSLLLQAALFRGAMRLVHGELVYVFADPATQTSRPVPPPLREVFQAFEAGQPMVEVQVVGGSGLADDAKALRQAVFVGELGLPAALEQDAADADSLHAVARNRLGRVLATGRLQAEAPGVGRIGRLAVTPLLRGSGIGRKVLDRLLEAARQRGEREVRLAAQVDAAPFYQRAGFTRCGAAFEQGGIDHLEMVRAA